MKRFRNLAGALTLSLAIMVVTFASRPTLADDPTDRGTVRSCAPYCYNPEYLFAATRELRDSCDSRTVVAALSPLSVALDIALLPFEILLGCFG